MKGGLILQNVDVPEPPFEVEEAERTGTTVTTEVTAEITTIGATTAMTKNVTTVAGNTLSVQCVTDFTSAQPDATHVKEWDT